METVENAKKRFFIDLWNDPLEFASFIEKAEPINERYSFYEQYKPDKIDLKRFRVGEYADIERYKCVLDDIVCEDKVASASVDVVGSRPIISRVLAGNPYNMYNRSTKRSVQLNCNILIDMSVSSGVSNGTIKEIGKKVLATIERLELEGHSLGIIAGCSGSIESFSDLMAVRIKEIGEPLELTKISYPLSNPSFLRRFNFYWHTLYKEIEYMPNLGHPITCDFSQDMLSNEISKAIGEKTLYLPFTLFNGWREERIFDYIKEQLTELDKNVFLEL